MTIQEHAAQVGKEAAKEAFRYAKAMPADKLEWQPVETARSAIDMCRELAKTPDWAYEVLTGEESGDREAQQREMASWSTIEECENAFNEKYKRLEALYKSMPDAKLSETKWLPYDGGRDFTFLEMLEYPRWNATYHLGQICYIQRMYGDVEMH